MHFENALIISLTSKVIDNNIQLTLFEMEGCEKRLLQGCLEIGDFDTSRQNDKRWDPQYPEYFWV